MEMSSMTSPQQNLIEQMEFYVDYRELCYDNIMLILQCQSEWMFFCCNISTSWIWNSANDWSKNTQISYLYNSKFMYNLNVLPLIYSKNELIFNLASWRWTVVYLKFHQMTVSLGHWAYSLAHNRIHYNCEIWWK